MPDDVKVEGADAPGKEATPTGGAKPEEKLPFNEHPRWKEVYGAYSEYKKYGSVQDIETRLQRAAELEEAFAEAQQLAAQEADEAGKTKGEKESEELMRQARAELRRLLPELNELENLKAAQAARYQRLEQAAISETRAVLKEIGEEDSVSEVRAMSDILADIIKNDAGLHSEYEVNPKGAVRGAFEKFSKHFQAKGERAAAAAKQRDREAAAKLPKSHGAGGSGEGQGGEGAPKNLAEATQRAMARLKGMEL